MDTLRTQQLPQRCLQIPMSMHQRETRHHVRIISTRQTWTVLRHSTCFGVSGDPNKHASAQFQDNGYEADMDKIAIKFCSQLVGGRWLGP